jgi:hypothetical protein
MLGVCGAFRFLSTRPKISGAMLGLATATKMAPAVLILLLVRSRNALVAFAIVLTLLAATLLLVSHKSVSRYIQVVERTIPQQSGRPDNGSFVGQAHHKFGRFGLALSTVFLATVLWANRREVTSGSLAGWSTFSYLAVACLPILWVYSVVPLLFLGRWAFAYARISLLFFVTFMASTTVLHIWNTPILLATSVVWLGVGVMVTGFRNSKSSPWGIEAGARHNPILLVRAAFDKSAVALP